MDDVNEALTPEAPATPGMRLHNARLASGKSLEDLATQTRVPVRLIDALERDAYDEIPAGPYATGFARSLARALGLSEQDLVADVRAARQQQGAGITAAMEEYEPLDSGRVPGRTLAWTGLVLAVLLIGGYMAFRHWSNTPDTPQPAVAAETAQASDTAAPATSGTATSGAAPAAAPVAVPAELANAPVRISASERVWFSLEDANGRGQFDLTLNPGEFYTVKPAQRGLFLRTGRPQALRVMIGDQRVPQLGANDATVSGIGLDAQSLVQRLNGQTPAGPTPAVAVSGANAAQSSATAPVAPSTGTGAR